VVAVEDRRAGDGRDRSGLLTPAIIYVGRGCYPSSMGSESTIAASVRRATAADAAEIATLVNRAYEVEGFFVEGNRTDEAEVAALCERGEILVLDGPHVPGEPRTIVASVHVHAEAGGAVGALGMLSVAPGLQGRGLGKRMVAVAEALCAAMGCIAMGLNVVNLRTELEAWYRSLGYRPIATEPYVDRAVRRPCHFIVMQKPLAESLAA